MSDRSKRFDDLYHGNRLLLLPYFRMSAGQFEESLLRARAYLDAGASGIYPIGAKDPGAIRALVAGIPAPVKIMGRLDPVFLAELQAMGVTRVSMGPQFQAYALNAMKEKAVECWESI